MNWLRKLQVRLRALFRKRQLDAEMDEEMRSHIEMQTQENLDAGMKPPEARYAALRQFGGVESIKETCREQRGVNWMEHLIQDLRYGLRMLRKNPGSSVLALLILALGIGGTTAVFSVADKVLLNPIPGRNSDRLVTLQEVDVMHDSHWHVSPPLIEELLTCSNLIESLTYCFQSSEEKKLRVGAETIKLRGASVAPNFFELLELRPLAGRAFLAGEGRREAEKTIIISHGLWQQYFGGDPQIIGRDIELDGSAYSVIGIMPSNVQFPFGSEESQFWVPHAFPSEEIDSDWAPRNRTWMTIGKLRDGVKLPALESMLDAVAARRRQSVSEPNQRWTIQAKPARESFSSETVQKTVWCLLAMMGALLLIACANVGNLLLSRAISRRCEFGVRMAIGAGRLRIARQLLVEGLTLAGVAAALGVFVAGGGIDALGQFYLSQLPRLNAIGLDWGVLGITCLVSGTAGVLFATAPAWLAARTNMNQSLKESAQQHSGGRVQRMLQDGLVVTQTSLAVVLLVGAALMVQSAVKLLRVDPGLDPKGLYRASYDPKPFLEVPRGEAPPDSIRRLLRLNEMMVERLRSVPAVELAAIHDDSGGAATSYEDYQVEGWHDLVRLSPSRIGIRSGDYFRTLRLRLIAGRLLTEQDCSPGQQAVVVNQELARRCWSGQSPLGKRLSHGGKEDKEEYVVVGVVKDIMAWKKDLPQQPTLYIPVERITTGFGYARGEFAIRSILGPDVLRDLAMRSGREMSPSIELNGLSCVEADLSRSTAPRGVMMWVLISLGGLGLLLSALGVYAVLDYAVARRTREVGIRIAMGAGRSQIRGLFLRHGVRLVANGLVLGIAAAITAGVYMESLLYGVKPTDPWAFAAVVLTLVVVGGIACWLPARRVARVDPVEALRYE